jgi:murein L,D-transpeptidase YcbB/YkuD
MRTVRCNHIITATLALSLTATVAGWAGPETATEAESEKIEAVSAPVPSPEPAAISPAAADTNELSTGALEAPSTIAATPADTDLNARVPLPAPLDLPPPSAQDVAAPAVTPETPDRAAAPATAQTPEPEKELKAPTASVVATDDPIVGKLREVITSKSSRIIDRPRDRAAVEAFYTARQYAPLWIENGAASERAIAAIAHLAAVAADGLDAADYPTPDFKASADPAALAQAELKLTNSVLAYARHAQVGRVHYSRVSEDIAYNQVAPEPADILSKMAEAKNVGDALASYNPAHQGYKALRAKLAEARAKTGETGPARIAGGSVLKVGMQDQRVPQLRARLGVAGDAANTTYDKAVAAAVKKFQGQHDLSETGNLNSATVEALNGPRRQREADIIIANMERWRWMPRDLGKAHVVLNVPDYTLKVVNGEKVVWTTRVVTGKPGKMATPILSETMKYITINPTWNVPPSIINNEYLPALQQDPNALERIGLKIKYDSDGDIHIYQPPGEGNALGRIRFNFPNKFLVYQHDTPDKQLFAQEKRAFSHGCMRVQYPDKYAEVLLGISQPNEGWTAEKLHKMYGNNEQNINLAHPIPVHITYQTAFVDEAGRLQIRDDVYGRDAALLAILKGSERRIADVAVERRETTTTVRKDIQLPYRTYGEARAPGYAREASFFDMLFGGGSYAPATPVPAKKRRTYTR